MNVEKMLKYFEFIIYCMGLINIICGVIIGSTLYGDWIFFIGIGIVTIILSMQIKNARLKWYRK